jgi:ABC-2 type transport system permease protein
VSGSTRPPRPGVLGALAVRDFLIARSYRGSLFVGFAVGVLNLAVAYYISQTFPEQPTAALQGAPNYFAFAAVGIAITVVLQATSISIARGVREEQLTGTLEMLAAQPATSAELAIGMAGFPFLLSVVRAAVYLLVAGAVFGLDVSNADWVGFVAVLAATGLAFVGVGVAIGAVVLITKRGEGLVALVTAAAGFLGGGFFPRSQLPDWLEPLADAIPITYAFDGVRSALFKGGDWEGSALALLLFGVIGIPVAVALFGLALNRTKRLGTLSNY